MCQKRRSVELLLKGHILRLDSCIREEIRSLNARGIETVASCCGHGVYPRTVLYRNAFGRIQDIKSGAIIPRARNLYRMDGRGFYYVPEVSAPK